MGNVSVTGLSHLSYPYCHFHIVHYNISHIVNNSSQQNITRSDILQGQALFRGVKSLRRCLVMLNNFKNFSFPSIEKRWTKDKETDGQKEKRQEKTKNKKKKTKTKTKKQKQKQKNKNKNKNKKNKNKNKKT